MRSLIVLPLLLLLSRSAPPDDSASAFLARARDAIGGADALARVHGLHIAVIDDIRPNSGRPPFTGDWLGGGGREGRSRVATHIWLAPPSRFLTTTGASRGGFDGDRPIGASPAVVRSPLWRWALPLLLTDPGALGLTLAGESAATLGGKAVTILDVTGPDSFEMRLYFDSASTRLAMTQVAVRAVAYSGDTGTRLGSRVVSEQDAYSDYKRVRSADLSIVLPFRIRREIEIRGSPRTSELDVVGYTLNPKNFDEQFK